jgi:hypothetical protein
MPASRHWLCYGVAIAFCAKRRNWDWKSIAPFQMRMAKQPLLRLRTIHWMDLKSLLAVLLVGRVRTVPALRRSFVVDGKHMLDPGTWEYDCEHFGDDVDQKDLSGWNTKAETLLTDDGEDPHALQEALKQAEAEMKTAEAEAKRKAEKMEQALARRMGNKGSNMDEAGG